MASIEIKNLYFEYSKNNKIFENLNISIKENTINVILGLNGCGKTTLIKLLAGLMKQKSGEIIVNNTPILSLSDHERSKLIAYVPQITSNRIAFTTEEYLLLSLTNQKSIYWKPGEKDKAAVKEFAKKFEISEDKLNRRVDELSGGERQIVMICGALLQNSEIIILDEPTAALDMKNQYAVLQFLKRCNKEQNKTIIFSCHDPNHALRLGGETVALHKGEVFLSGESRKILKAANLKSIYGENICDLKDSKFNFITIDW